MNAVLDVEKLVPAWQALRSVAPLAHIESESDYEQATALLNSLLDIVLGRKKGQPQKEPQKEPQKGSG